MYKETKDISYSRVKEVQISPDYKSYIITTSEYPYAEAREVKREFKLAVIGAEGVFPLQSIEDLFFRFSGILVEDKKQIPRKDEIMDEIKIELEKQKVLQKSLESQGYIKKAKKPNTFKRDTMKRLKKK